MSPDACEPEDHLSGRMKLKYIIGVGVALAMSCQATIINTYVGVDTGAGLGPYPFSTAAQAAFLAAIGSPSSTTTFESSAISSATPQTIGAITFTCTGCLTTADPFAQGVHIVDSVPTEDGFNTTSGGTKFYRSTASGFGGTNSLTLSFATPISAFGAYFVGNETFYGTTSITFNDGAPQTFFLADTGNNTQNGPAGGQFFGFRDTVGINSITFTTTNNATFRDLWAIDDILIQGSGVPEPGAVGLTGLGLAVLLYLRRKHRGARNTR